MQVDNTLVSLILHLRSVREPRRAATKMIVTEIDMKFLAMTAAVLGIGLLSSAANAQPLAAPQIFLQPPVASPAPVAVAQAPIRMPWWVSGYGSVELLEREMRAPPVRGAVLPSSLQALKAATPRPAASPASLPAAQATTRMPWWVSGYGSVELLEREMRAPPVRGAVLPRSLQALKVAPQPSSAMPAPVPTPLPGLASGFSSPEQLQRETQGPGLPGHWGGG